MAGCFLLLFLMIIPLVHSLSFSFDRFTPSNVRNITFERTSVVNSSIQLTSDRLASIGRATYAEPLHLWDKATGNLSAFNTHFAFVIDSKGSNRYGDGFAFFLAPLGSRIPPNATKGGGFGLANDAERLNSSRNTFVAVEFDIYLNDEYDSQSKQVGIDVDSLQSVVAQSWFPDIEGGKPNEAWINYDPRSMNLSVVYSSTENNRSTFDRVSYVVDLRKYLPERVTFGFAGATGNRSALQMINSWNFTSTFIGQDHADPDRKIISKGLVIGVVVGGCFLIGGGSMAILFVEWRKRRMREQFDDDIFGDIGGGAGPKKFTYRELARATNNFSKQDKLGEGGFGSVYKGYLKELDSYVAVKRVSRGSKQGIKEYASEVRIISRIRHRNLVQLIGWCHENKDLLLVYEFLSNGSLDSHLYKGQSLLTWPLRYKIVQDLASALLYLHEECEKCIVHRDIKSSNVMLDSDLNAKLGDFGLARLVDHEKGSRTTALAGTMGYIALECVVSGKASKETDIYSFGIVTLEIATGRKPIDHTADEECSVNIVEWAWKLYGTGQLLDAADANLSGEFDGREVEQMLIVGLWCAHPDSSLRPSIRQAIQALNFEAPLPDLPESIPVVTFRPQPNVPYSPYQGSDVSQTSQTHSLIYSSNTDGSCSSAI